uniref:Cilia- and flagella-associated protein 36 n=1 Tax=Aureoumbra lagunensis TaxID=44058 RepID=A0A7S3K6G9_9STRA|mmetsp:Transcript_3045/g.4235  ORF Transcript_3045/g.4235 Transcript_3045/m.4235 type:complete len:122 (-) Transcript_3045:81-446(-)
MDIVVEVTELILEDDEFANELEKFCQKNCTIFACDLDEDEHKFEYSELHEDFCLLFERRIEAFVQNRGYSITEFWQRLTKAIDDDSLHSFNAIPCFDLLKAATDYSTFVTTMRSLSRTSKT